MQQTIFNMLDGSPKGENVAILVGPNGARKSTLLRRIAIQYRYDRRVAIICNTAYDRFTGISGIDRISAGRSGQSPKSIIKRAVGITLGEDGRRYYQINTIMEYCGYLPRFGFRIRPGNRYRSRRDMPALFDELRMQDDFFRAPRTSSTDPADFERALEFLDRHRPEEMVWVDPRESSIEVAKGFDFSAVLRHEKALKSLKFVRGIDVYLQRRDQEVIELRHASSGQLSLISSLVFLITTVDENPLVIVDEPENSLHPSWQREYVDKLLAALSYRNANIIIATHAPLLVTGAIAQNPKQVSVYQVHEGEPERLAIDGSTAPTNGVEEVLWRAFEMVTPASHFVSEEIVQAISRYDSGDASKESVIDLVNEMDASSYDEKQKGFFGDVRKLIDDVERRKTAGADDNG